MIRILNVWVPLHIFFKEMYCSPITGCSLGNEWQESFDPNMLTYYYLVVFCAHVCIQV